MMNYAKSKNYEGGMLMEDQSKTTNQNFTKSKQLIKVKENIAFATTDYHVFRSGVIASKAGFRRIEGISAKSPWYFYNNALIREFVANLKAEWKIHLINLIAMDAFLILLIVIGVIFDI